MECSKWLHPFARGWYGRTDMRNDYTIWRQIVSSLKFGVKLGL